MRHGTAAVAGPVVDSVRDPQGSRMTKCQPPGWRKLSSGKENCGFGPRCATRDKASRIPPAQRPFDGCCIVVITACCDVLSREQVRHTSEPIHEEEVRQNTRQMGALELADSSERSSGMISRP